MQSTFEQDTPETISVFVVLTKREDSCAEFFDQIDALARIYRYVQKNVLKSDTCLFFLDTRKMLIWIPKNLTIQGQVLQ